MTIRIKSFCFILTNYTKQVKMINAFIFRLPTKPSSESMNIRSVTRIEIDYTTISTLHKLIDK